MVAIVTAALLLASPDELRRPLTPDEAFEAPPPTPPAVAPPDAAFDTPPAPRWPGILAQWVGGTVLTVSTFYGGVTAAETALFTGPVGQVRGRQAESLINTGLLVGGGVIAMLAGMGYLAWVQPDEEPRPKSPGYVALNTGVTEIIGGVMRYLMVSDVEPFLSAERRSAATIIGSGAVAVAAGIVWLIWANLN
jgi:hypothetical protein